MVLEPGDGSPAPLTAGLDMRSFRLEVCVGDAGLESVTLDDGVLALGLDQEQQSFSGSLTFGAGWRLDIAVLAGVDLGLGFTLDGAHLTVTEPEPGQAFVWLEADIDVGGPDDDPLPLHASGECHTDLDFSVGLSLREGASWEVPNAGGDLLEAPTLDSLSGELGYETDGQGWWASVTLGLTGEIADLGTLSAVGTLAFETGDQAVEGCLAALAPLEMEAGVPGDLLGFSAELCFGPAGFWAELQLAGWLPVPGLYVSKASGRVEYLDDPWAFHVSVGDLEAADDPTGNHLLLMIAPAGLLEVVGELEVDLGGPGSRPGRRPRRLAALCAHDWPGNLRELRHEMQRATVMAGVRPDIRPEDLAFVSGRAPASTAPARDATLPEKVAALERREIEAALTRLHGNRTRAAAALGLSRQGLLKKMARYGLAG